MQQNKHNYDWCRRRTIKLGSLNVSNQWSRCSQWRLRLILFLICFCEPSQVSKVCSDIWFQSGGFSPLISLLSALLVGFHYQIPPADSLCTPPFLPLCFQKLFLFQCKKKTLNATKSSSPMRVHGYPSRPLKAVSVSWHRAVLFYATSCVSCMKIQLHFFFLVYFVLNYQSICVATNASTCSSNLFQ